MPVDEVAWHRQEVNGENGTDCKDMLPPLAAVSSFQGMLSAVPFLTIGHLDVARFDYQSRPANAKFSSKIRR